MNRSARRPSAAALLTTSIACFAPNLGCATDTASNTWFLGSVEAGTPEVGPEPDSTIPVTVGELLPRSCPGSVLHGADELTLVRQVAALQSRLIVTTTDGVDAWQLDATGCPLTKIDTFGDKGHVAIDALCAGPLPGGRALVANGTRSVVLDTTGAIVGQCADEGSEVKARFVDIRADGRAVALTVRSPVEVLQTNLDNPTLCAASKQELAPQAFAVLAITHSRGAEGWVAVEQDNGYAPIGLSRYDASGTRVASATWPDALDAGHLCSAAGVVETDRGIVVADSACKRVLVYDSSTLQPTWQAALQDTPRGVAYGGDAPQVLVPATRIVASGAQAIFLVIDLQP